MSFEAISKGIMFLFDNYSEVEKYAEFISKIDLAESDTEIKENVKAIHKLMKELFDDNYLIVEKMFEGFVNFKEVI